MVPVIVILLLLPSAVEVSGPQLKLLTLPQLSTPSLWTPSPDINLIVISPTSNQLLALGYTHVCGFDAYFARMKPVTYQIWGLNAANARKLKKEFAYTPSRNGRNRLFVNCPYKLEPGDVVGFEQASGSSIGITDANTRTDAYLGTTTNNVVVTGDGTRTVPNPDQMFTKQPLYGFALWMGKSVSDCPNNECENETPAPTTKEPTTVEPTTLEPTLETTNKTESSSGGKKKTGGCRPATGTAESTVYNKLVILTALLCFFLLI